MRIATFNLQNLRLRQPGGRPHLDGAVDDDVAEVPRAPELDEADRRLTAETVAKADADVIALQEVFDRAALDFFHDRFLRPTGTRPYPYRICRPGNDGRGLEVAAMSRLPPRGIESHAALTGADLGLDDLSEDLRAHPLFRRDCLRIDLDRVTLFICHFKAPYPDVDRARLIRDAEARAVRRIVETAFDHPAAARWIVLGDFNEPGGGDGAGALAALTGEFACDLSARAATGPDWTYETFDTHRHARPDRILVSPRLARDYPDARPEVIRSGMRRGVRRPHASDHALLYADFPGL